MIADKIQKTSLTLKERGVPDDSFFEVVFEDDSRVNEKETNWSFFSHRRIVDYLGNPKVCFVSDYQIKSIIIFMNGLETCIDIPKGTDVYQFMRSERLLAQEVDNNKIVGRGVGLVKNGTIIEERFINAIENNIAGMRK